MTPLSQDEHSSDSSTSSSPAAYPGEDTRPTSRKELLGFYTYSFAAEVFVVCGLGAFIPITLEDLARASPTAVRADDHSKACNSHPNGIDLYKPRDGLTQFGTSKASSKQCVFNLLGAEVNTASFAMYTFSISVLLQALVVVTMSGAADHGRYRKALLVTFALTGSIATMLFLPVTPAVYWLGSLWAMVGNVCIGASFVLLNSFLPLLVRHHPAVQLTNDSGEARTSRESGAEDERQGSGEHSDRQVADDTTPLLQAAEQTTTPYPPSAAAPSPQMQLSTRISSYGVGIGYIASIMVQFLSVFILRTTGGSLFSLRLVLFAIGLWWLSFMIPAAIWLRPRPGPPLSYRHGSKRLSWSGYIAYSWVNLGKTVARARRLKDVLLFLGAWFLVSDAIATVSGTAILFAKTTLGMESSALALINVMVTLSGIAGAFTWSKVSRMMQLTPSQTILTCICLFELIPLYGLLGYVPGIHRLGCFGLQQQWEMYPLGAVYGLVLGGLSSYCRSLYGELIPPGSEAAFYALYAITDKGSSVFGPAIVGAITDATGEIRPAFFFLAILVGLPIPLMYHVNVDRGRRDPAVLAEENVPHVGEEEEAEE
ncbi:MFS general substrate transporter [Hortaea werneckii]|nr:MFS general substrate transporter [Hortaea werneckii]KAI7102010.1 MFS general substrate transporter [Hortaea werneckii]KAI7219142.1 MFS general substrate transporter [Hortaea werneckii]KAI7326521.1 MFS general substrate transporter [Hortaea werneckii]KAI7387979.1 MFS general substrate transporter [Hortaea werneckii]